MSTGIPSHGFSIPIILQFLYCSPVKDGQIHSFIHSSAKVTKSTGPLGWDVTKHPYLSHPETHSFVPDQGFSLPNHWFVFRINFQAQFAIEISKSIGSRITRESCLFSVGSYISTSGCVFSSVGSTPHGYSRMTEVGVFKIPSLFLQVFCWTSWVSIGEFRIPSENYLKYQQGGTDTGGPNPIKTGNGYGKNRSVTVLKSRYLFDIFNIFCRI